MKKCKLCEKKHEARGYCQRHYARFKKYGLTGIDRPYREQLYREKNEIISKDSYHILKANKGDIAVDNIDYEKIKIYKWYVGKNGYAYAHIDGKQRIMHRFILGLKSGLIIDHINRNRSDNRRINLRKCTLSQNGYNKKRQSNNTSGYTGVVFCSRTNKWRAWIYVDKKRIDLGRHTTKEAAALIYNKAAKKYHGEFANLNNIIL